MKHPASRRTARLALIGASLAACLIASACSSSGNSASTGNGSSASGADSASAAADAAAAEAKLAPVKVAPTKITLTTPLPSKPAPGTMVWMNCDIPACTVIGNGVKAAVEAAGWTFKTENYKSSDPATLTSALQRALGEHPTAVSLSGISPTAGWSSVVPAYKSANVPIIPMFLGPTQLDSTIVANVGGPPAREEPAKTMARWFIADSGGKGEALLQRVDGFPVVKVWADTFKATVQAECKACKVDELSNTIADATSGNIVPTIIPKLKSNPSIKYVFGDLEFYDGLPSAMSAAGLTGKVKVAGQTPDVTGENYLKQGVFAAATPAGNNYAGWLTADVAFRIAAKLPIPAADQGSMPYQLLLPDTDFNINAGYDKPSDYPEQFKALWKIG